MDQNENGGYVMFKDGDLFNEIEGTLPDNQSHV
ncbi:putative glutamine amidotransferase [Actinobacillus equuli]|nr:putative glutamine amidotransferase [Actinobacillus equuli]